MMKTSFAAMMAIFLMLAASAGADTLTLADGRTFEGKVIVKDNVYTVLSGDKLYQFRKRMVREFNGKVICPVIRISTEKGDMLAVLYEDDVPNTVANMIALAESGFYKGMTFHRVIPGFMAQGGCPNSKDGATGVPGTGGPGYKFADEISPELKHSGRGILSMANSGPNTNGSQFFLCFKEAPHLDGKHAVFGKVVSGLNVLDAIEAIGSPSGTPSEKVHFNIEVVAKRDHPYVVKKLDDGKKKPAAKKPATKKDGGKK